MSLWSVGEVGSATLNLRPLGPPSTSSSSSLPNQRANDFKHFVKNFTSEGTANFKYREQLKSNYLQSLYYLSIDLSDLMHFASPLAQFAIDRPSEAIGLFEGALEEIAAQIINAQSEEKIHPIQLQIRNYPRHTEIRHLSSNAVSRLVTLRGIVVSAGRPRVKATRLTIQCRNCKVNKTLHTSSGFGISRLPRECDTKISADSGMAKCGLDPFQIIADNSDYVDQQRLKLQELPEAVPTGELPRHLSLALDRYLVGSVKPGTRVTCVGMYTTYEANNGSEGRSMGSVGDVGIRIPYLRVFGIDQENEANEFLLGRFDPRDEERMVELSRSPALADRIAASIAPAIFDSEDIKNVKKAIAVQLFGGSRKILPDGMRLRGDVNVLLLGDPSVAKSQFLKFATSIAPIGVYTSGKGSSAAGLTATVIRDSSSGEFSLEGGALVLADGGLVCIDEFDKMRESDRVAIHEAMEQQTISIAKAGITTILNSRTSVLAAANPAFGRYDDLRSTTENIDFATTILSRFDMIFILRDFQDQQRDINLAKYVINVHRHRDAAIDRQQGNNEQKGLIELGLLKKYIAYARQKCSPRLDEFASKKLQDKYVHFRQTINNKVGGAANGTSIPITVRQLEAIIRISESLARMELLSEATDRHVDEALRLFQVSTYRAATQGTQSQGTGTSDGTVNITQTAEFDKSVKLAESEIRSRLPIGSSMRVLDVIKLGIARNLDERTVKRAIQIMVDRREIVAKAQGKQIQRVI